MHAGTKNGTLVCRRRQPAGQRVGLERETGTDCIIAGVHVGGSVLIWKPCTQRGSRAGDKARQKVLGVLEAQLNEGC